MSSSRAWQIHGCYKLGDETFSGEPLLSGPAAEGCGDDSISLDHRDPSHPTRNILKRIFELRQHYPVLNDGFSLTALSNQTDNVYLNGSGDIATPFGMWSVYRSQAEGVQDLGSAGNQGDQGVWLMYSNLNYSEEFAFDCQKQSGALIAPFIPDTTVKNLFYPYDEHVLEASTVNVTISGTEQTAGCFSNLTFDPWGFKAYVPKDAFVDPAPSITGLIPSHDERLLSTVAVGETQTVPIEIHFSQEMDCDAILDALSINSTTAGGIVAQIKDDSSNCTSLDNPESTAYSGQPATQWIFKATLENVAHGIHTLTVTNASTANTSDTRYTNAVDTFMFRLGADSNPVVFPQIGNYSTELLKQNDSTGDLYIAHQAAGAELFRYSRTWGSSWSDWIEYPESEVTAPLESQTWTGTQKQAWDGQHLIVQYWSRAAGSAAHIQHGDLSSTKPRRWPHAYVFGEWNTWGYDSGLSSSMHLANSSDNETVWAFDLAAEWPTSTQINVWGMNRKYFRLHPTRYSRKHKY